MLRALALAVLVCTTPPALADQRDPRLDILFEALSGADIEAAVRIEGEIWRIWLQCGEGREIELMQVGMIAMQMGDMATALDAFSTIIDRTPDCAEGWNKRATVLYLIGDLEGSLTDVNATLALEPRHFGALSGAGLIFDALGQPAAALQAYRRALAVHPQLPHAQSRVRTLERELGGQEL